MSSFLIALGLLAGGLAGSGVAGAVPANAATGALFYPSLLGLLPTLHGPHFCSASVVHSAGRDLVVTAAHCVFGLGVGIEFAPGFAHGSTPYGIWEVERIYVDPAWQRTEAPEDDVAFLQIAPNEGHRIEDVVGARPLGTPVTAPVTVSGYPMTADDPVSCTAPLTLTSGYPTVRCAGLSDGTSGGPWVQDGRVVGVVGGLQQGGCTAEVSYSAPFGSAVEELWRRAEAGGTGDLAPIALLASSGC